ncbi:hypothetical protein QQX98_004672 [Neonectria punicea]|uniref:Amino acid permease/ SLC12A domain-containing protein n=1 Tax=Neonectria punicea TaxID=979145 RepID=A0ABR1H7Y6_9HYPO
MDKETMKPEQEVDLARSDSLSHGEVGGTIPEGTTTQRGLKSRHAQMIALGGTIGTGLFVGAGQGLKMGGPVFLLVAYIIITLLLYGVATAMGEMSSYMPVYGCSMSYYGNRYVSRSLGFTMGWVYFYVFAITVPAEINVTTIVIEYWNPPVHTGVWLTLVGIVIIACNCFPVKVYGETEFWFASTKVIGIIGLLIMSVVLFFGGGPSGEPLYFKYWSDPGPINEYLVGGAVGRLCAFVGTITFSVYAFAFAPELLVVTGGEMESPRRNIPKATVRYFYRLITFYILGALAIGLTVPSNHPDPLSVGSGAAASPWAIGIRDAGIKVLDSVVNAIIVLSAWSAGNSYLYLASRALYSLAVDGNAPKIFTRCTKSGIPYYATAANASFSLLAYLNLVSTGGTVFNWFVNLGITDIPFRSKLQPYAAWVSLVGFSVLLLLQGFKVFVKGNWDTPTFITAYIGIPIFLALYFGHRFTVGRNDKWALRPEEIDLQTGLDEIMALETPPPPMEKWHQKWRRVFE